MKYKKIVSIVGARPNFVKIAPVLRQLKLHRRVKSVLVHTGQHYDRDMSGVFFEQLSLPSPDVYLAVGSSAASQQIAMIMTKLECVLLKLEPDLVIVVGDVNSTLAAALTAKKLNIPVAHIEAGLRSFDKAMPEETNRMVTDTISDFLFTPSKDADKNLIAEGISKEKIFFVGNVMIDTLMQAKKLIENNTITQKLRINNSNYAVVTLHRPSNVDNLEDFDRLYRALKEIAKQIKIVFPMHPRTKFFAAKFGVDNDFKKLQNILTVDPMGYLDFLTLLKNALFVITDSGGIQEETTVLGVPCLTVRENTERPVTVSEGTNIVVGLNPRKIINESLKIMKGEKRHSRIPKLWDGRASERIVKILVS